MEITILSSSPEPEPSRSIPPARIPTSFPSNVSATANNNNNTGPFSFSDSDDDDGSGLAPPIPPPAPAAAVPAFVSITPAERIRLAVEADRVQAHLTAREMEGVNYFDPPPAPVQFFQPQFQVSKPAKIQNKERRRNRVALSSSPEPSPSPPPAPPPVAQGYGYRSQVPNYPFGVVSGVSGYGNSSAGQYQQTGGAGPSSSVRSSHQSAAAGSHRPAEQRRRRSDSIDPATLTRIKPPPLSLRERQEKDRAAEADFLNEEMQKYLELRAEQDAQYILEEETKRERERERERERYREQQARASPRKWTIVSEPMATAAAAIPNRPAAAPPARQSSVKSEFQGIAPQSSAAFSKSASKSASASTSKSASVTTLASTAATAYPSSKGQYAISPLPARSQSQQSQQPPSSVITATTATTATTSRSNNGKTSSRRKKHGPKRIVPGPNTEYIKLDEPPLESWMTRPGFEGLAILGTAQPVRHATPELLESDDECPSWRNILVMNLEPRPDCGRTFFPLDLSLEGERPVPNNHGAPSVKRQKRTPQPAIMRAASVPKEVLPDKPPRPKAPPAPRTNNYYISESSDDDPDVMDISHATGYRSDGGTFYQYTESERLQRELHKSWMPSSEKRQVKPKLRPDGSLALTYGSQRAEVKKSGDLQTKVTGKNSPIRSKSSVDRGISVESPRKSTLVKPFQDHISIPSSDQSAPYLRDSSPSIRIMTPSTSIKPTRIRNLTPKGRIRQADAMELANKLSNSKLKSRSRSRALFNSRSKRRPRSNKRRKPRLEGFSTSGRRLYSWIDLSETDSGYSSASDLDQTTKTVQKISRRAPESRNSAPQLAARPRKGSGHRMRRDVEEAKSWPERISFYLQSNPDIGRFSLRHSRLSSDYIQEYNNRHKIPLHASLPDGIHLQTDPDSTTPMILNAETNGDSRMETDDEIEVIPAVCGQVDDSGYASSSSDSDIIRIA